MTGVMHQNQLLQSLVTDVFINDCSLMTKITPMTVVTIRMTAVITEFI